MNGRHIVRFYTGSGYSEKQALWLCSDGRFYKLFDGGGFTPGVASGVFQSGNSGSWKATGMQGQNGTLMLRYGQGKRVQGETSYGSGSEMEAGGGESTYTLSLTDEGLFLDGKRWLRDKNNRCN